MIPKIYIASEWKDMQKINELTKKFSEICEITHDWTIHDDHSLLNNKAYIKCQTLLCEDGISKADYVIAIMDDPLNNYIQTWTEIGISIGSDIPVIIYNPINNINIDNIYIQHQLLRVFTNLNDIVKYLTS